MAEKVRIRQPGQHALLDPVSGGHVTPGLHERFDADSPLVKAHPWAFGTDAELAAEAEADRQREWVSLAQITEQPEAAAVKGRARK